MKAKNQKRENRIKEKAINKERKLILTRLKDIVNVSKSIARKWDRNTIPLKTLKLTLRLAKAKVTGDEYQIEHATAFNNTLDSLYDGCAEIAKNMNSENIPVSEIENGIDLIKIAYN